MVDERIGPHLLVLPSATGTFLGLWSRPGDGTACGPPIDVEWRCIGSSVRTPLWESCRRIIFPSQINQDRGTDQSSGVRGERQKGRGYVCTSYNGTYGKTWSY